MCIRDRPNPYHENHGEYLPDENLILIYDVNPEDAIRTFVHELFEYRLTPLLNKYRLLINALIDFYEKSLEQEKEFLIERLVSDFHVLIGEVRPTNPTVSSRMRGGRGRAKTRKGGGNK